jgi:hypothetical protein
MTDRNCGTIEWNILGGHRRVIEISRHFSGWSEDSYNKSSIKYQLNIIPAEIRIGCLLNTRKALQLDQPTVKSSAISGY